MKKRILLVAHEEDVLESFPVAMTSAGYDVSLGHAGLQAIRQARELSPDLIVIDATLPDMDGATARDILQRLPSTSRIPALLLKPRPHRLMPLPLQDESIRAGLTQPLNPGELLLQVEEALALFQEQQLEAELAEMAENYV
ncbi:MAG: response regulator [Verrucomicrobiota bacterium]|jgi:PleD family two-component response regulator